MPDDSQNSPIEEILPESPAVDVPTPVTGTEPTFDLSIFVEQSAISLRFECAGHTEEWTAPKTVVRRAHKAVPVDSVFDILGAGPVLGCLLRNAVTNEPQYLMVPRAVNALTDRVMKALRKIQKDAAKAAGAHTVRETEAIASK